MNVKDLIPCPFCGVALETMDSGAQHPGDECILSQLVVFDTGFEGWNSRSAMPPYYSFVAGMNTAIEMVATTRNAHNPGPEFALLNGLLGDIENARRQFQREARPLSGSAPSRQKTHLRITYTNWRGETAERTIVPFGLRFDATQWHPEPQWIMAAWDVEKYAARDFALKDMRFQPDDVTRAEIYAQIEAMPRREELLGGQRTQYVQLHEVLAWIGAKP